MKKSSELRAPNGQAKSLAAVTKATARLWRRAGLGYDATRVVSREARRLAGVSRPEQRRNVVDRLTADEARRLIDHAYRAGGARGLMIKTLLASGARVSEFVRLTAGDFAREERSLLIRRGKGGTGRAIPVLPALVDELSTYLAGRASGPLFRTRTGSAFTARRVQQVVKAVAIEAGVTKRVHPHLLRHTVAQDLLDGGMPLEHVQRFLGHEQIGTTQIYARSTPAAIRASHSAAARRHAEAPS